MKTCSRCREAKPFDAFYADKTKRDGHSSRCRICCVLYSLSWRGANPEKYRAQCKARYEANIEKEKARSKARYEADPEKFKSQVVGWREANPEKERARARRRDLRTVALMPASYLAKSMRLPVAAVTPELLALKREQLETHRLAKMAKQHLKEIKDETRTDSE